MNKLKAMTNAASYKFSPSHPAGPDLAGAESGVEREAPAEAPVPRSSQPLPGREEAGNGALNGRGPFWSGEEGLERNRAGGCISDRRRFRRCVRFGHRATAGRRERERGVERRRN